MLKYISENNRLTQYMLMPIKIKSTLLLCIVIITGVGGILWYFRVSENYFFWKYFGSEKIAVTLNPDDPDLFLEIGNGYFGHGKTYDVKRAEMAYTRALEIRPDFLEAHYQLGRIHFINGKFTSALAEIDTVLRIDPNFKKAYYMHGLINGYKGDLDAAIWGFSEFIKRDDFNWAGYNDLAWIYFKKGDYQKMKEVAEKGLIHAERNPWLNNIYGTALMNLGEKDSAKKAFRVALEESNTMSAEDWGQAYPGNNPEIYSRGIEETRSVIKHNLTLLESFDEDNLPK